MVSLGKYALEQLQLLCGQVPDGQLHDLTNPGKQTIHVLPDAFKHITDDPSGRSILPAFEGKMEGRTVRLELVPASDPTMRLINAFVTANAGELCFAVDAKGNESSYQVLSGVPTFAFTLGLPEFDEVYSFSSSNISLAQSFLSVPENASVIKTLPRFERFILGSHFARLSRKVAVHGDVDCQVLYGLLSDLAKAVDFIEKRLGSIKNAEEK